MSGKGRYGRPGSGHFLKMVFVNGLLSLAALKVLYALFGVQPILQARLAESALTQAASRWNTLWPMLPGAAVGFACLWFWLILTGRSRGLSWGGALFYGVMIAFGNVSMAGFLTGLAHGNLAMALLLALLGLIYILLIPSLTLMMACFGLIMGGLNGWFAARWIERVRPR